MTHDAGGDVRVAKVISLPAIVRRRLDNKDFVYLWFLTVFELIKPVCALFYCNKT